MFNSKSSVLRARSTAGTVATVAAVLGALSWYVVIPAHADEQRTVEFDDLNLSREADVNKLYARLQRAAEKVCQKNNGREHYQRRLYRECHAEALERAVAGINAVQLTKLHAARDTTAQRNQRAG
jgi:UrcA family protein